MAAQFAAALFPSKHSNLRHPVGNGPLPKKSALSSNHLATDHSIHLQRISSVQLARPVPRELQVQLASVESAAIAAREAGEASLDPLARPVQLVQPVQLAQLVQLVQPEPLVRLE